MRTRHPTSIFNTTGVRLSNAARKLLRRLVRMTLRDLLVIGLPMLIVVCAAFWITYQFVRPAPPDHLVITTSGPEGSFQRVATRYKEIFDRNGMRLELKTSKGVIDRVNRDFVKALGTPDVKEKLRAQGIDPMGSTPEELVAHQKQETAKWGKVIREQNIRFE